MSVVFLLCSSCCLVVVTVMVYCVILFILVCCVFVRGSVHESPFALFVYVCVFHGFIMLSCCLRFCGCVVCVCSRLVVVFMIRLPLRCICLFIVPQLLLMVRCLVMCVMVVCLLVCVFARCWAPLCCALLG